MKVGSILENQNNEKRIAITPEIVKKYLSLGIEVSLSENYGSNLGIDDRKYLELGAKIHKDSAEIISNSDIIAQLGLPSDESLLNLKENQTIIGVLNPYDLSLIHI